jgi:hypothetical protein
MSRVLGPELPPSLLEQLSGRDLKDRFGRVIPAVTLDAVGFPHPALLSFGEVVALDARRIGLATAADSTTTRNMRERGRLTLLLVEPEGTYYITGTVRERPAGLPGFPGLAHLEMRVEQVLQDATRGDVEGDARITSGLRFESGSGGAALLRRWEALVAALRNAE